MNFIFHSEIIDYKFINTGRNKTILFLHGWGGNKNSFLSTINLLKSKFNILTLTMPTTKNTKTIWRLNDYRDLILNILSTNSIKSVIIICHSFGFRVACRLNGLINIEKIIVTGGAGLRQKNVFRRIENNNNIILLKQKRFRYLYDKIASVDYKNLSKINKLSFKEIINFNCKNLIKFSCPMFLFWGQFDHSTPLWMAKEIKRKNNAKLFVTKSDHFAYLNKGALFNNLIKEFVND